MCLPFRQGNFVTFSIKATGNGPTGNEVQGRLGAVVASLLAFIAAGFIFGHLGHAVGDRARGWLLTSLVWQTTFVAVASILVSADVIHTSSGLNWVLVMLFSLAGGAQVAMAKGCGNPLISTVRAAGPRSVSCPPGGRADLRLTFACRSLNSRRPS